MSKWPTVPLVEVSKVLAGNPAPQDKVQFHEGTHLFVRTSDIGKIRIGRIYDSRDKLNDSAVRNMRVFRKGVTLIPKSGASTFLNHRVQLGHAACVSSHLAVVDADNTALNDDYIYYFLQTICAQDLIADQSYPSLNLTAVGSVLIPLPPLEEQKRIVALLDATFAKIAAAEEKQEAVARNAAELFNSISNNLLTGNPDAPTVPLGDVCSFVRGPFGGSLKKSIFVSNGNAVYEQQHPIYQRFDKFRYFITDEKYDEMKRFAVISGDVLMSCSGTIGKSVIVPEGAPRGIINQALLKLRCSDDLLNTYLSHWMFSGLFQDAVMSSAGGAALQNVASVSVLKEIEISLPPLKEQKRIVALLDAAKEQSDKIAANAARALACQAEVKAAVLHRAFEGAL